MFDSITVQTAAESANIQTLIYTILLSFILSSLLAIIYQKTRGSQNFSKNYIQSIVLISLISTILIQAIGDSLARGLGIMAAMAIVRFRNNLKDPRDLLFLFASLAAGISCGAYSFDIAIVGTIGFSISVIILYFSPLGPDKEKELNGVLSFSLSAKSKEKQYADKFMQHYCHNFLLKELKEEADDKFGYSYKVCLKNDSSYEELFRRLKRLPSIQNIKLKMLNQEKT